MFTPTPNTRIAQQGFSVCNHVSMEILTKENLVGAKTAPTAVSRTFTPLVRKIRLPY